jgi:hypothetical protein
VTLKITQECSGTDIDPEFLTPRLGSPHLTRLPSFACVSQRGPYSSNSPLLALCLRKEGASGNVRARTALRGQNGKGRGGSSE